MPTVEELQETQKFNDGGQNRKFIIPELARISSEKLKRNADDFDVPKYPKKVKTEDFDIPKYPKKVKTEDLSDSNSSLKMLLSEKSNIRSKIISWRRNTKSLTDQIVMNSD